MLTIPPETRSENGNPALRRRPADAETSFTPLNHTALLGQCQTEVGDGNAHVMKLSPDWMKFSTRGVASQLCLLSIGSLCYQGFPGDSPKQKGQMDKDAVAILKRNTSRHNQSIACIAMAMQDDGQFNSLL